jgi:DNA modification methylase
MAPETANLGPAVIYRGDALEVMRTLPAESVQCCVTSPPYYGLRDYGVEGQIGLEETPEKYVGRLVELFAEVRRVLRADGTLWLNLGDSYVANGGGGERRMVELGRPSPGALSQPHQLCDKKRSTQTPGLKPKDLMGIPWQVAFALRSDGWVLRSDVIWSKPNPMPESVTDRPTKSHEYVFIFSKAKWVGESRTEFDRISDTDARWLALFLDTEGNIAVKRVERDGRKWYGAQICFAGTCRPLLEAAQEIIGKGTILERAGKNSPMFYLQLSNRQASGLLRRLYPFLIVKRRQARIAIHLQTLLRHRGGRGADKRRTDGEVAALESLWLRNKECNRFGAPDLLDVPEPRFGRWIPERYAYDADAIKEKSTGQQGAAAEFFRPNGSKGRDGRCIEGAPSGNEARLTGRQDSGNRNARSVWTITTQPCPEAHFAVMPKKLARRCILAGCPEGGTVLDPFTGAGTTGLVAIEEGRRFVGSELNPDYLVIARRRIRKAVLADRSSLFPAFPSPT